MQLRKLRFLGRRSYAIGFMTMLVSSTMYNRWPVPPRKWRLRRLDQAAIHLLIATTPFILQINDSGFATKFLIGCEALHCGRCFEAELADHR
jgi:predicted membrane channel-forming protein YqfA (hemolysin III family)